MYCMLTMCHECTINFTVVYFLKLTYTFTKYNKKTKRIYSKKLPGYLGNS